MSNQPPPQPPHEQRYHEYEDPGYHDDVEVVVPEGSDDAVRKTQARRKPITRKHPVKRRQFEED
jgi:hypothetical protein